MSKEFCASRNCSTRKDSPSSGRASICAAKARATKSRARCLFPCTRFPILSRFARVCATYSRCSPPATKRNPRLPWEPRKESFRLDVEKGCGQNFYQAPLLLGTKFMQHIALILIAQLFLVFGLAGLFWPEKFVAAFQLLMYPWSSSYRLIRMNSIGSLGLALVLAVGILLRTF